MSVSVNETAPPAVALAGQQTKEVITTTPGARARTPKDDDLLPVTPHQTT
jgi:hypothetical protein